MNLKLKLGNGSRPVGEFVNDLGLMEIFYTIFFVIFLINCNFTSGKLKKCESGNSTLQILAWKCSSSLPGCSRSFRLENLINYLCFVKTDLLGNFISY